MPHVTEKATYYWVTAALFVLLALTVIAAELEAGSWNVPIAMAIACARRHLSSPFLCTCGRARLSCESLQLQAACG